MKNIYHFLLVSILLFSDVDAYGQSFSCTPEDVTFAGNTTSGLKIEKTTVNWKRIDYHVLDKKAVSMTYKDPKDAATKINPAQREELTVLESSSERVVMLGGQTTNPLALTVDVIFPLDGNGYSFYVSDYPKTHSPGKSELINLSKLYVLKCKDISKAVQ